MFLARCVASTFPRPEPIVRRMGKVRGKAMVNLGQNSLGDDDHNCSFSGFFLSVFYVMMCTYKKGVKMG